MNKWMAHGGYRHFDPEELVTHLGFIKFGLLFSFGRHIRCSFWSQGSEFRSELDELVRGVFKICTHSRKARDGKTGPLISLQWPLVSKWPLGRALGGGEAFKSLQSAKKNLPCVECSETGSAGASSQSDRNRWGQPNGRLQRLKRARWRCLLGDGNSAPMQSSRVT